VDGQRVTAVTEGPPVTEGHRSAKQRVTAVTEGPSPPADNHRPSLAGKETMKETMIPPTPQRGGVDGFEDEKNLRKLIARIEQRMADHRRSGAITQRQSVITQKHRNRMRQFLAADGSLKRKAQVWDEAITETLELIDSGVFVNHPFSVVLKRAGLLLALPAPPAEPDYPIVTPTLKFRIKWLRDRLKRRRPPEGVEPDEVTAAEIAQFEAELAECEAQLAQQEEVPPSA
jgi:hypothetical protein